MIIRPNPVSTSECDSFDEVRKLMDNIYGVLRENDSIVQDNQRRITDNEEAIKKLQPKPPAKTTKKSK